jgi:hypothetical protein
MSKYISMKFWQRTDQVIIAALAITGLLNPYFL